MAEKNASGLQRKTKAELIDIILRKDAVHAKLQEEIKTQNDQINDLKTEINSLNIDIEGLQGEIDNNVRCINNQQKIINEKENQIEDFKEGFDKQAYDMLNTKVEIRAYRVAIMLLILLMLIIVF